MKILLAPDKFRGSMTAAEACQALTEGIRLADQTIETVSTPLADGGEGILEILTEATSGTKRQVTVADPLGRPIEAEFGLSADGQTAFVELASASGLHHLVPGERDALRANTFGTGQLLRAALEAGATRIILGVGGSASTDGGTGMAAALGYRFLDEHDSELVPCGKTLSQIARIDSAAVPFDFSKIKIEVACDVTAPLYGPEGAAFVYAPQKGASPEQVVVLDAGLQHLEQKAPDEAPPSWAIVERAGTVRRAGALPGAGAAGGTGFGAIVFLNATLRPGTDLVMELTRFDEALEGVDLVITGEGKLDAQTLQGKLIGGVCRRAAARGIRVVALCGTLDADPLALRAMGLAYVASILTRPMTLDEALHEGPTLLKNAAFFVVNLFKLVDSR
ncbi:MAG: glycerate kinase [Sphingobacteriaceae bacterium]|nr:glycerate kinase [Cytophagaceae bacterium]